MNDPVIDVQALTKTFVSGSDRIRVLENISFQASEGESVSIVGASGCGKSTLLNLIGGLDSVDSGSIRVGDYPVTGLGEKGLTRYRSLGVGFVFQFHYLLKDFTALENVMLPMVMAGRGRSEASELAGHALEQVKVAGRSSHYPSQLSGGERQRIALARALVNDPALILADEPTGNLDEAHKSLVADLLFSLTAESGRTLVLVTHASDLAARADRRFRLSEGALVAE